MEQPISSDDRRLMLEHALALDPEFVRAMRQLVQKLTLNYFFDDQPELVTQSERLIDRIRQLAPQSIDHLAAQSLYSYYVLRRYPEALELIVQALDKAPIDQNLLEIKYAIHRRMGDEQGRIETVRRLTLIDPKSPRWANSLAGSLLHSHRYDEAQQVLDGTKSETPALQMKRNELAFREHQDSDRFVNDVIDVIEKFDRSNGTRWVEDLLHAHIMARDYAAAGQLLESIQFPVPPNQPEELMSRKLGYELIVTHLSGDRDGFEKALAVAREITSGHEANMKDSPAWLAYQLDLTLVAPFDGQAKQVETRVRQIRRRFADDNTTLGGVLSRMCQLLGISGAGKAAASCLRRALIEPSFVRYYMEPKLPYYDSVREHPDFVQLVADIDAGNL